MKLIIFICPFFK